MAHIHTGQNEHDHTASAFIVLRRGLEPRKVLLHRHKVLNKFLQPGGHVELNENVWQAINHEIPEETGYEMNQLQILQPEHSVIFPLGDSIQHPTPLLVSTHAFGNDHYHTDTAYAFETDELPNKLPGEDESSELIWFTRPELVKLSDKDTVPDIRAIALSLLSGAFDRWKPTCVSHFRKHV